jgi:metallo-beta-lactamase class B
VFDNLYYVGSSNENNQAIWAVTTSDGIVLIDTGYEYSVEELVTNGLKKMGLDPAQIKYVILAHAHAHSFFGATYIQKTYPRARLIMSEADWNVLAKSTEPAELKPRKDMVATDGMKLTLGDTTLTLYITPGHTPGTVSTLVPLKDGNRKHLGYVLGGRGWTEQEAGVRYFQDEQTALKTWIASIKRFYGMAAKEGADVFLAIHPQHDHLFEKMDRLKLHRSRDPNAPHPFVSKDAIKNHTTIMTECMEAQLLWLAGANSK